jgi:opacity protein-like surface antigen
MKIKILIISILCITVRTFSQENTVTLSGGYAFANVEDTDSKGTGWRINALYEFSMMDGKFAHGLSLGYISISSSEEVGLQQTVESQVYSIPLYYAPKYMFGNEKIKGFVKGALGAQLAHLSSEGYISVDDWDAGFYGGGGAGVMFFIKSNIFINAEYEIAWASNNFYKDGWMNTIMGGIGFKF